MLPKGNFPSIVYLNGEFLPAEMARVSVFDRGFLFGDGIYEVMVQLEQGMFYKRAHLDRLQRNLEAIGIPYRVEGLERALDPLLEASGLVGRDCMVYMQLSRGTAPRKHSFPQGVPPTVMMYALPLPLPHINTKTMKAISMVDSRWERCDIKSISLLGNVMANGAAIGKGYDEAIMVRDGLITEGSHTNIFFVKDRALHTHPANHHILDGISRKLVVALVRELDIPLIEKAVPLEDIAGMDEAFLTGTTTQIASLVQLDGHTYHAPDEIGPMTHKLQLAFARLRETDSSELTL